MKQARGGSGLRRIVVWLGLGLLLTAHAAGLVGTSSGTFSNPDAPGYLLQARGLATAGTTGLRPESPAQFVDLQFLNVEGGEFRSRYPPGLPVLQALPYRLGGVPAALAVNPVLAVLGGLLLFLLARRWVGPWLALFGVLLYATLPVLNEQALMGMAHVAVATALVAALLTFDFWSERPTKGRAILLGFVLGAMPALRYPAALPTVVIGTFAALRCVRSAAHRRTAWIGAVGVAAPLAALLAHNTVAYGSPLATGYGLTGEDAAFSLHYLQLNILGYLDSIRAAAGAVALFGLGGVIAMLRLPEWRTRGALLFVLVTAWTLLYAAYYWSLTGPRFLLPVFTLLVVAAVSLLHLLRPFVLRAALAMVLAGWHLAVAVDDGLPRVERLADELRTAEQVLGELRTAVPARSVLIAPLAIRILAGPYGEWKLAEPSLLWPDRTDLVMPPLPDPPPGGKPVSPMQPGRTIELRSPFIGLDGAARTVAVLEELVRWAEPGKEVYFLGDPDALEEIEPHYARIGDFVAVGRLELPEVNAKSRRSGSRSPPDLRFWIPRPPLALVRFVPRVERRVERRVRGRKVERPQEVARLARPELAVHRRVLPFDRQRTLVPDTIQSPDDLLEGDAAPAERAEIPEALGVAERQMAAEHAGPARLRRPPDVLHVRVEDATRELADERDAVDALVGEVARIVVEAERRVVAQRFERAVRRHDVVGDLGRMHLERELHARVLERVEDRRPALGELREPGFDRLG